MDNPRNAPPAPPQWLLVVVCGAAVLALSMGVRQVSGLFLRPVVMDLGLSREGFGFAVALQNLVWGVTQPIAGYLADRYGARPVAMGGGLFYVAGIALAALAPTGIIFTLGLGLLAGIGQAGTAFAVVLALVGRVAPERSRSLALGLGSAAGSVGIFLLVPATSALLDDLDWRYAMLSLAGLLALMPLLAIALQDVTPAATDPGTDAPRPNLPSARETAALANRDRDFWLLNFGFAACGFQLAFVATYVPAILLDAGLGLSAGAAVLAAIGASNIPGTYLAGLAGGRWPKTWVLAAIYLARAAAMFGFIALPLSTASAVAFGVAIGVLWTGTVPLTSGLVADLWGRRNLGFLFGLVYVGHQLGAFVGAWAGGFVFDRTGSFAPVWAAAITVSLVSAAFHLKVRLAPRAPALAEARA